MEEHKYTLYDIDRMIPWEREVYIQLLIKNLKETAINERIRDLKYKDNILYMFMENSASIGIIDLHENK